MRLIARLLNFFYRHLYHGLAFAYDAVAVLVSFGQWVEWTKATLPFIEGTRLLELGHGPGHLQRLLLDRAETFQSRETLRQAQGNALDSASQEGGVGDAQGRDRVRGCASLG